MKCFRISVPMENGGSVLDITPFLIWGIMLSARKRQGKRKRHPLPCRDPREHPCLSSLGIRVNPTSWVLVKRSFGDFRAWKPKLLGNSREHGKASLHAISPVISFCVAGGNCFPWVLQMPIETRKHPDCVGCNPSGLTQGSWCEDLRPTQVDRTECWGVWGQRSRPFEVCVLAVILSSSSLAPLTLQPTSKIRLPRSPGGPPCTPREVSVLDLLLQVYSLLQPPWGSELLLEKSPAAKHTPPPPASPRALAKSCATLWWWEEQQQSG